MSSCRLSPSQCCIWWNSQWKCSVFIRSSLPAVAEQVIEVPAVSLPVRAVQRVVPLEPHVAKQLVEVPTVLSVARAPAADCRAGR